MPSIHNSLNPAYLTTDLPGIGGVIKQRHEDFLVEEQPLYEPVGQGEHLYLFVEKQGLTTHDVIKKLAKAFRVRKSAIGHAGLKDKHAITRQHFSVHLPKADEEEAFLAHLEKYKFLRVLWSARHANKLRRGHHGGNRFVIRIRNVEPTSVLTAKPILDRLAHTGIPNFLGEQRFGYRQNSHLLGQHLLRGEDQCFLDEMLGRPCDQDLDTLAQGRRAYVQGDYALALEHWPRNLPYDRQALDALRQGKSAPQAVQSIDANQRHFLLSAMQSAIFNTALNMRLEQGLFDRLIPGDLAWKHEGRAVFAVDQATAELENQPDGRVGQMAVSPSGPLWGPDMIRAQGDIDALECEALRQHNLSVEQITAPTALNFTGNRRPGRVALTDPDLAGGVDEHGPYVRVSFELPRGAFATIALREIMKVADEPESVSPNEGAS